MTVLNRATVRAAFSAGVAAAVSGTGKPAEIVYDYMPDTLQGQSPVVLVLSRGVRRAIRGMGAKKYDNQFDLEVHVLVYDGESNPLTPAQREDKVDEIEAAVAEYCVQNQNSATWRALTYTPETTTEILVTKFFDGVPYRFEVIPVQVEAPDL